MLPPLAPVIIAKLNYSPILFIKVSTVINKINYIEVTITTPYSQSGGAGAPPGGRNI